MGCEMRGGDFVSMKFELSSRAIDLFMSHVEMEPNSGCWLWTGRWSEDGYGRSARRESDGKSHNRMAHRVSYEMLVGKVPHGMFLDHLCRTRCCVNPMHLEPVTNRENVIRGRFPSMVKERLSKITHCPKGHEYTQDNTYIRIFNGYKCRQCMICRNSRDKSRDRKKERRVSE